MAERAARHQRYICDEAGLPRLADHFVAVHGDQVLHGPFVGLRYWRGGDAAVAKLLGAYESEISPWFTHALAASPPLFLDLGAADGYYAVGVKVASPDTEVVAFEISATARRELVELATLNGVTIDIRRRASPGRFGACPSAGRCFSVTSKARRLMCCHPWPPRSREPCSSWSFMSTRAEVADLLGAAGGDSYDRGRRRRRTRARLIP